MPKAAAAFALLLPLARCFVVPAPILSRPVHAVRASQPPALLFSVFGKPSPPPAPKPEPEDVSFGKALRRLQGSPARAAMAAVYFSALFYVFSGAAPPSPPDETVALILECVDPAAAPSVFFCIFNSLGIMPALYAAVLLPGAKNQSPLPAAPFLAAAFFAGYGATGPYLALRQPRPGPVSRSELGFVGRTVTESRVFGGAMLLSSLLLAAKLLAIDDWPAAVATYRALFDSVQLVNVSSFDLLVLSLFFFEPAREDMQRRGWYAAPGVQATPAQVLRLAAFCAVPVVGPAAYVFARPALPGEEE